MKYVLFIDQVFVCKHKISFAAAAIYDAILFSMGRKYKQSKSIGSTVFYNCERTLVSKLLPMLCDESGTIPRATWSKNLKILKEIGLIDLHPDNKRERRTFIALGPNSHLYKFDRKQEPDDIDIDIEEVSCIDETKEKKTSIRSQQVIAVQSASTETKREQEALQETKQNSVASIRVEALVPTPVDTESLPAEAQEPILVGTKNNKVRNRVRNKSKKSYLTLTSFELSSAREVIESEKDDELLRYFDESTQVWASWLDYRRSIRKPYKNERTFALAVRAAYKQSPYVDDLRRAVDVSIASGWQGLFVKCSKKSSNQLNIPAGGPAAPASEQNRTMSADRAISSYDELSEEQLRAKQDPSLIRQRINALLTSR